MSFRMDLSAKQDIDNRLTQLSKVQALLHRKTAPLQGFQLFDALCPINREHLWTQAKVAGLEELLRTTEDFTFSLSYDDAEGKSREAEINFKTSAQRIRWPSEVTMKHDHPLYESFASWVIKQEEAGNKYREHSELITEVVSTCSSIGQVKRLINDVFDYLPERYIRHVEGYQRKPRLHHHLQYLESYEGAKKMIDLCNALTVGKLFEDQVEGVDGYWSEVPSIHALR